MLDSSATPCQVTGTGNGYIAYPRIPPADLVDAYLAIGAAADELHARGEHRAEIAARRFLAWLAGYGLGDFRP